MSLVFSLLIHWIFVLTATAGIAFPTSTHYVQCGTNTQMYCPDPKYTPGDIDQLTKDQLCNPAFHTSSVRNVPQSEKRRACLEYGQTVGCPGPRYEIDHLISIELGGSNDLQNLWPQPIDQARVKDVVENRLHREVCEGNISLLDAQSMIKTDWTRVPIQFKVVSVPSVGYFYCGKLDPPGIPVKDAFEAMPNGGVLEFEEGSQTAEYSSITCDNR